VRKEKNGASGWANQKAGGGTKETGGRIPNSLKGGKKKNERDRNWLKGEVKGGVETQGVGSCLEVTEHKVARH